MLKLFLTRPSPLRNIFMATRISVNARAAAFALETIMRRDFEGLGVHDGHLVGWLGHHDAVKPQMSVHENLDFFARLAGVRRIYALLPGLGWVGFDPTNNLIAAERHIRTAVGRDYADVPPTMSPVSAGC